MTYVNTEDCRDKHRIGWRVTALLVTIGLCVCGWALRATNGATEAAITATEASIEATKAATVVGAKLETHAARQNGSLETINERMKGFDKQLQAAKETRDKTYKMTLDLWEHQHKASAP